MRGLLAVLSGIMLGLSLPPNPFGALEWVALVPLFIAVRRSRPLVAAGWGGLTILVASTLMVFPLRSPEEWGNAGGGCGIFGLVMLWTCAWAASSRAVSPWLWALGVASAGVIGEWAAHALFPVYLAMGQWKNPAIMPVASWVGIWGISFLVYGFNAVLAAAIERTQSLTPQMAPFSRREARRVVLIATGGVAALHLFGLAWNARDMPGTPLKAAAIQPDAEDMLPLLQAARNQGAEVAVWPELALSEPLERDLEAHRVPGLYQVIGHSGEMPLEGLPENFAAMVSPEGDVLGRYSKIHLFGSESEVHRAGGQLTVVPTPFGRAGLAICFDTMFTEVTRELARQGAQAVFVPNLDPEAGRGALHALHAATTVFRVAETGIPLVRSEWRGYSMIVDGRGRIVAETGMEAPRVITGEITLPARPGTLYTRTGDLFPMLCLAALLLLALREMREDGKKRRERRSETVPSPAEEPIGVN